MFLYKNQTSTTTTTDGNCRLYNESGHRVQFLGGYESNTNEMCYKYRLHEYKHKKMDKQNSTITWSMKICPDGNDIEYGYGKVSDYLSNVLFIKNNNEKDSYYTDDTHFYYVSHGEDSQISQDPEIELCFKSDDLDSLHEASIITETEYCIKHGNKDKLCSKRGVSVTDICGLKSVVRENNHSPAAPIDYVPKPGQSYKFGSFYYYYYYCCCFVSLIVCILLFILE